MVADAKKAPEAEEGPAPSQRRGSPTFWQSPLSYIVFEWFTPILLKGSKRTLKYDDLFDMPPALKTDHVYPKFQEEWEQQVASVGERGEEGKALVESAKKGETSRFLLRSIALRHRWRLFFALALQCFYSGIQFAGPLMLNQITKILMKTGQAQDDVLYKGYIFASVMLVAPLLGALAAGMSNRLSIGTQIMLRAELTAAIYRKALRLSTRAKQQTETGRIVNHMSADVNQLQMFFYPFANQLVTGPAMLITSVVLLWFQIKWATFIGLGILLVSTPATGIFVKKITMFRREMLKYTDQRVKLMNQLLVGVRVLKMYAWESAQEAMVLEVRRNELNQLGRAIPFRVGMQTLLFAAPTLAMVTCFAVYGSAEPDSFTPARIFTSIAYFSLMRFPLIFLPFALVQLTNALVSMRRLTAYFMLEERNDYVEHSQQPGALIEGGNFFWSEPPLKQPPPGKGGEAGGKKGKKKNKGRKGKQEEAAAKDAPATNGVHHANTNGHAATKGHAAANGKAGDDAAVKVELPGMKEEEGGQEGGKPADGGDAAKPAAGQGTAAWWLRDINLEVKAGELVCVVGRVGSGKSSLVQALLGEMERESGHVRVGGCVAYAAQQAWIVNATVKGNVTFGRAFDEERWEMCVDACCLRSDLDVLPGGAETEIGEKGINLSGGQKQRISLARALYQDADFYILDDPLSAVDVHVGKHIFDNLIEGALKDKARLLVTHQLQYLPQADRVVVLEGGRIVAQGTYQDCLANHSFARLLAEHNSHAGAEEGGEGGEGGKDDPQLSEGSDGEGGAEAAAPERSPLLRADTKLIQARVAEDAVDLAPGTLGRADMEKGQPRKGVSFVDPPATAAEGGGAGAEAGQGEQFGKQLRRFETMRMQNEEADVKNKKQLAEEAAANGKEEGKPANGKAGPGGKGSLMIREDQEEGHVSMQVYWRYICAYGVIAFISLMALFCCEQTMRILTTWWLSRWTQAEGQNIQAQALGLPAPNSRIGYIGGYIGFALGFVVLTGGRSLTNLTSCLRASRVIHLRTLATLVRAPVTFFDTTPVGRILNRFSKDTDDVDFLLTMSMSEFFNCIFQLLATLIFIAVIQPWILCGVAPLGVVYYLLQRFYRASYIELQRLDSVSRSPIYAHFSESLGGVETIRAYRLAASFAQQSDDKVDSNHRAYFCVRMANEWLSQRLDCLGACIVFLAAILAIVNRDNISASLAAMTLSEALDVTMFLKAAVTSGAMFETRFNSVERLTAYWELPQEAPAKKPELEPEQSWPEEGHITYEDVWMRYRPELDPVLKGVSFDVRPGDKIGIVGRTGSGKSSLIVSLFRLVEPFRGRIMLDGVNILELGLDDVRGRIAAIPQDPVLFSGTVRSNLDPFSRYTDAELWDALSHVSLKEVVAAQPEGLSARVAESGDNYSVGQRQLLCVARALLRQPQVLVADEATSNVDSETDALIQRTLRREFKHCTVLTIAHRINTILDATKVLVMDEGVVGEYDSVPNLMGRTASTFRRMVTSAGLEAAATSLSRRGSQASLAGSRRGSMSSIKELDGGEEEGEEGGSKQSPPASGKQQQLRRPEGMQTFVKRMRDQHGLQ